ncbi:MAG: M36 family metallopeptidase [Planctomycetes bacterium]|nr:M36 family metallopeptidase [Planctomycetota bacterium]
MKKGSFFPFAARLAILVTGVISPGFLFAEDGTILLRPPHPRARLGLERLKSLSLEPIATRWSPFTGRVQSLEGLYPLAPSRPARLGGADDLAGRVLRFLAGEPDLFGWSPGTELRLLSSAQELGTTHLRFQAFIQGIRVAGSEAAVHLQAPPPGEPAIRLVTCRLHPELEIDQDGRPGGRWTPRLSAREAIAVAEAALGPSAAFRQPASAHLEILPLPAPARLIYAVRLHASRPHGAWEARVDAHLGAVVSRTDLLRYAPAPRNGTGRVFIVSPVVALQSHTLSDLDDNAAAIPEEAYTQVALPDLDGEGGLTGPYVTTAPTPGAVRRVRLDFSFKRDHDGFEEVMAYYHIDAAQRFIQSLGFSNASNQQIPVYANSEPPGVPYTDSQAYYQPDENNPGTGLIAFGSGGVDTAEDPEIIVHEYGHAIQDNQVPGFGNPFESMQSAAIGEGWADWIAAVYLSAFSRGYGDACLGEWGQVDAPLQPGEEPKECIRRLDSTKHFPEAMVGEPHDDGEMWSASLWRIFERLGRESSLRLVLKSNFYLSAAATFEEAAGAVLRADRELNGGANQDFLRQVFLDRGFFSPPLNLNWFYLKGHSPPLALPEFGETVSSKARIARAGAISGQPEHKILVYVNLSHPFPGILTLSLRSPSGTTVLLNDGGGRIFAGGPLIFGRGLEPAEPLEKLAGEPVAGVWSLEIGGSFLGEGSLSEWGLRFQGFMRGDANQDGQLSVEDALAMLYYLFASGPLACAKAGDFNDNGLVNVTDAVGLLLHQFGMGPPPPEPYPEAGEDLTPDALDCEG